MMTDIVLSAFVLGIMGLSWYDFRRRVEKFEQVMDEQQKARIRDAEFYLTNVEKLSETVKSSIAETETKLSAMHKTLQPESEPEPFEENPDIEEVNQRSSGHPYRHK